MSESYLPLLIIFCLVVLLRVFAWWALELVSGFFHQSKTLIGQARDRRKLIGLWSRFKRSFPETSQHLHARLTPTRFSGLTLTLFVIASLYVLALFGGLVEELLEADELTRFDHLINQQVAMIRTDIMITVFAWVTDLGGSAALIAIIIVTTGLLWTHRGGILIAPLWLTIVGSVLTTQAGKYLLQRQRPDVVTDVVAITYSFPSGHATSAMAVYGFIAYMIVSQLATIRQRFEVVYWTSVLICLVGFSRVLLGVHYVSDVVAGLLVGSFWLLLGIAFAEQIKKQH